MISAALWALALCCPSVAVCVGDGNSFVWERDGRHPIIFPECISASPITDIAEQKAFAGLRNDIRVQSGSVGDARQHKRSYARLTILQGEKGSWDVNGKVLSHFLVWDKNHAPLLTDFSKSQMFFDEGGVSVAAGPEGVKPTTPYTDDIGGRLTHIFDRHGYSKAEVVGGEICNVVCADGEGYPRPMLQFSYPLGDLIGFFGFFESRPDKKHADSTEAHAYHGSGAHHVGPQSGLFLGYKVLFVALMCAAFVACLGNAVRLIDRGLADAGIPYLFIGIFGILTSLIIGLPLVFGGP